MKENSVLSKSSIVCHSEVCQSTITLYDNDIDETSRFRTHFVPTIKLFECAKKCSFVGVWESDKTNGATYKPLP